MGIVHGLIPSRLARRLRNTPAAARIARLIRELSAIQRPADVLTIRQALEARVRRLRDSQSLLEAVLDNTNNGIILVAPDLTILYANRRMGEFFGLDAPSMIGRNKRAVLAHELKHSVVDPEGFVQRLLYLYAHLEETAVDEVEVATPTRRILDRYSAPVYRDTGELVGRIEVYSDITEVRDLQRNKDTFLSLVSHELRTPVTSVKGYAQLLRRRARGQDVPPQTLEAYETIDRQATRMQQLIDLMLDLSRLETGRLQLQVSRVDLLALTQRVMKMVQIMTDQHELVLAAPDGPLWIEGDERRLEQVVMNLLNNAVRYSPDGCTVEIAIMAEDSAVQVAVSDGGIGIAPDALSRVFERFYQAEGVSESSGMGIGLYVSRAIAEMHGGSLVAASELGKGSTFTLVLPAGIHVGEQGGAS